MRGRIPLLSLNEVGEKSRVTISQNQTLIGLYFSENVLPWSKFKARSHNVFFSLTFGLLLINSRYLVTGVYFSPHQRNLHGKTIMKYQS